VFFTSATLTANALLFGGFEGQTLMSVVNGFLGFVIMVAGVFLLYSPSSLGSNGINVNSTNQNNLLELELFK